MEPTKIRLMGIVLVVIGVVIALVGFIVFSVGGSKVPSEEAEHTVFGSKVVFLEEKTYDIWVYGHVPSRDEINVTFPDGGELPISYAETPVTVSNDQGRYELLGQVKIPEQGNFTVNCDREVYITPPLNMESSIGNVCIFGGIGMVFIVIGGVLIFKSWSMEKKGKGIKLKWTHVGYQR